MHRLFAAIRPPRFIREKLLGVMGGVKGARWQSDDQLHLTLRFIGEVDRHRAEDVAAALGGVRHPPFEIALDGIGSFGRRGLPDSLWAGVAPQEELKALHNKVDQACRRVGIAPDRRVFHPHITIARLKGAAGSFRDIAEEAGGVASAPFTVDSFSLFESELAAQGAIYSLVARYPLA